MSELKLNRRQALTGAAVAGAAVLTGAVPAAAAAAARTPEADTATPFGLGVASGDPLPDGVILWTRLVRDPFNAGSMPARALPVAWQVAADERFHRVVRAGVAFARPELAHSVHVDVRGLAAGRDYFYRFRSAGQLSPVGRTRTAPALFADPEVLRLAVVSCQDFQNGYWPAFNGLAEEDLDVVFHLGDYIYEGDPQSLFPDRSHVPPQTLGLGQLRTLDDYRNRHAQYKGDPALRAAHAAVPWVAAAAHLPPFRLRPAGPFQRAGHPAVPHRPARRLLQRPRSGGSRPGQRRGHPHRQRAGAMARRRADQLTRAVERHRPAGHDEPHPVPEPDRRLTAHDRQPRPVGRLPAAAGAPVAAAGRAAGGEPGRARR